MSEIKIDIIIPTLNSEDTVNHTLISVMHLKKFNIQPEIVVVDSDSNDSTIDIVKQYGIRILNYPKGNMYKAINYGLKIGNNKWCTYLNSDDIIYPEIFSLNLKKIDCEKGDIIYGNIDFINMDGHFLHSWNSPPPKDIPRIFKLNISPISQPGTIFSNNLFKNLNGFNENLKYSSDTDFFYRSFLMGAKFLKGSNRPVSAFRLHSNQFSRLKLLDIKKERNFIFLNSNIKENWLSLKLIRFKIYLRNVGNYLIRILRWLQLYHSIKIPKSIELGNL